MKTLVKRFTMAAATGSLLVATATGCASLNNTERGAVIGAGTGAAVGGVIGKQTGSTARGAIIGAVLGGAAGAVIGRQMDRQAEELDEELEGADVQRIGEGIAVTFESGILFPYNSTDILPAGRQNLREFAASLQRYPNTEVLIVGHTDSRGSDSYNMDLSQRRAQAAKSLLVQQGVASSRISTAGRGETEPIAPNDTEYNMQQNRRVEIVIFASEEYRQEILREQGRG